MPENLEVVETFQRIKSEANCDDLAAAILTLANSVSWIKVHLQVGETGYELDRVGKDIADAIEAVSKGGAIQLNVDADVFSKVLGQIDTSGSADSEPKKAKRKKARRK